MKFDQRWANLHPQEDALFHLFPRDGIKTIVEVGVYYGGWIKRCLGFLPKEATVYAIDPWQDVVTPHDKFVSTLGEELASGRVVEIRKKSLEAITQWDIPIDVLHLDGDHTDLLNDLVAWVPKVRKGGLITGHDVLGHRQSRWVFRDLHRYFGKNKPFFIGPIRGHTLGQALRIHSFWFWKDTEYGEQHSMRRKPKEAE